jgi:hypothetical protein
MNYQTTIHELDPTVNPAGVEASMRLQFGTLDHLDREEFKREIEIAKTCEAEAPGYLKSVAECYGMAKAFAYWAQRIDPCPFCGRIDAHAHVSGPFGMN